MTGEGQAGHINFLSFTINLVIIIIIIIIVLFGNASFLLNFVVGTPCVWNSPEPSRKIIIIVLLLLLPVIVLVLVHCAGACAAGGIQDGPRRDR